MVRSIFIAISGFLFISCQGFGQDTIPLSRQDALQKASESNLQIKIAQKNFESAQADYRQSNALFLPDISVSHTGIFTTNPLMAFGSKLNQERLTASDFNPELLNNPDKTENFASRIDVLQPIFNLDGLLERQAAKAKSEAYALQTERTREYLVLDINKAYMQLQVAYETAKVLENSIIATKANLKLTENYYNQGMLQKSDLLAMQVRMTEIENQLLYARSSVRNTSDYLSFLFNEEGGAKVYKPSEELTENVVSDKASASFSESRKDIQAMEKSLEAHKKLMHSSKMRFLPRLNAFGSYELYDKEIFNASANGYTVGAQLSWNLFDGYKSIGKKQKTKADYKKSELELDQYKAQSRLEFDKTNRQLNDAENKLNLSKSAFEQSKEAYRIVKNRFDQGLEKSSDLLITETKMLQKELEQLQAIFEYSYTRQYLQFITN